MSNLPPLASGSRPLLGHAVAMYRDAFPLIERGHREHGRVFSLDLAGKPAVVLLGNEHDRWLFKETDKLFSISEGMPFFARMFDPDMYFLAPPAEYQRQREILLPRFQARHLAKYVDIMTAETEAWIDGLGESGEFEIVDEFGPLIMRIAAKSFLGEDFGERLDTDFFAEFRRFSAGLDVIFPSWLPLPHFIKSRRARARLHTALGRLVDERRENPTDPPDFLQALSAATYSDGEPLPERLVINIVLGLTWVGQETTTGHASWALIHLLQHPGELAKVRAEQRDRLPAGPLSISEFRELRYLDAALHETERLRPVAQLIARGALEDIKVDEYVIPKGARVFLSPAITHRLPELFDEPETYAPQRFIDDPKSVQLLIGFGGGVHRCLGARFAYLEMQIIVTLLLRAMDLELVDPDPRPIAGPGTKWPQSPCRVRYTRRGRG
ncbi:cytochrome P450 [Phytomonospora endophytica]|uniref:Sterol 14-demethylase n=1 Tax=Phytomonospora endophytica TaxID=714109 RepID=A0A841FD72_9ACTN|nr:cytochrome P450 [Phytomonospora endophytica]MBB6035231.1 sterol 14-demethylase [Phytomonospora endophytica]GIG64019.1 cytochrome P450 [Phytomonospora endophytica]